MSLNLTEFSKLVERIYDSAIDASHWDDTMVLIKDALGSDNAILSLMDTQHHRLLLMKELNMEPGWAESQAPYWEEQNTFLDRVLAQTQSFDDPLVITRLSSPEERAASPYLQEWGYPRGYIDTMILMLMHAPDRHARLDMGFHKRNGDVVNDVQYEVARLLLPHIRRAVTISNVLDVRMIERNRMAETLDLLRYAVIITSASGRVLHANQAAERILRAGDLVSAHGGAVIAKRSSAASELEAAIKLAASNETELGKTGLAVVLTPKDAAPTVAHVLPLARGEYRTVLQPSAAAAIFIGRAADLEVSAREIASQFGLTSTEAKVLAELLAGRTLTEAAKALGVSVNTARTHLASIFGKTGVSRQADLIRLATQMEKFTAS